MARERRMEKALSWVGVGTVAGALLLAAVTVALHWAGQDTGVIKEVGLVWFWACFLGGFVLMLGVRWQPLYPGEHPDTESGWDYAFCLAGVAAVTALIAGNSVLLGAEAPGISELSPIELRMAIVVCAIPLGTLLMLTVVRRPLLLPRNRSLPFLASGALAVALLGTAVPPLLLDGEETGVRHVIAENPPERAAVPDQVRRSGWTWELEQHPDPDREVRVERITWGSHGPLAVLSDGVVSLDGTDGSEVWSYRDLDVDEASVWVGNGHVLFTHVLERDGDAEERDEPEVQVTQVLDRVTGDLVTEFSRDSGEGPDGTARDLVGWSDGVRVHSDWRDRNEWGDAAGVSAWDAESGEELWYLSRAPEGMLCEGGSPGVRSESVVHAVACVHEDDVTEGELIDGLLRRGDVAKQLRVVSVDLRTGQEQWTHELDGGDVFVPGRPWLAPGVGDQDSVLVVAGSYSSDPLLLLDPETGTELMHLTKEQVDIDEDLSREEILDVDGSGVTMLFYRYPRGSEVRHIDTDGNHTPLVGSGGSVVGRYTESVVLSEQVLFPDADSGKHGDRAQVRVASYGERLGEGLSNRIVLESERPVRQLVAVPGGVAALVREHSGDEHGSDVWVEGLVP